MAGMVQTAPIVGGMLTGGNVQLGSGSNFFQLHFLINHLNTRRMTTFFIILQITLPVRDILTVGIKESDRQTYTKPTVIDRAP